VVVSGEEGVVKPEPEIYRRCLERNGLAAGDCVFIDDNADNVAVARRMGIDGILFTEPRSLATKLRARGLPVRPRTGPQDGAGASG
jgi:FMN phosphatase YigB (HAD superfamily)